MKYQPEIYFAGWRYNFKDDSEWSVLPKQSKKLKYETEDIFRGWRRNFFVRERCDADEEVTERRQRKQVQPKMMPEKIFNEWLHNFHFKSRRNSKYGSLKRRTSKKETKEHGGVMNVEAEDEHEDFNNCNSLKNKSRTNRQRRSKNKRKNNDW